VTTQPTLRRASYGPTSPLIGERGARTRDRIVAQTLVLFGSMGFHETTVRDIAEAASVSRATLYQYFESKEDIFVELLEECGSALLSVIRGIGPLGPSSEGLDHLHQWLLEWTGVYSKYGTLFVQWANVDMPGSPVGALASNFQRSYNLRIANRFRRTGLIGMDAREAAIVTTSIIHRFNYLNFISRPTRADAQVAVRDIAILLQAILFPTTPLEALTEFGGPRPVRRRSRAARRRKAGPVARRSRTAAATERSSGTIARIMSAGAECFAAGGYYRANVDDIVARAGFARGTFYKYFDDKLDLLLALSQECEAGLLELNSRYAQIPPGPAGDVDLREWLPEFLAYRARYIGVLRSWIEGSPQHPELEQARERVGAGLHASQALQLETSVLRDVISARASEIMMVGVLERLPDAMSDNARPPRQARVVELIATVIERGLCQSDVEPA
jgi:AcrR family transcriptional regulator